jgi:hypothetical protein
MILVSGAKWGLGRVGGRRRRRRRREDGVSLPLSLSFSPLFPFCFFLSLSIKINIHLPLWKGEERRKEGERLKERARIYCIQKKRDLCAIFLYGSGGRRGAYPPAHCVAGLCIVAGMSSSVSRRRRARNGRCIRVERPAWARGEGAVGTEYATALGISQDGIDDSQPHSVAASDSPESLRAQNSGAACLQMSPQVAGGRSLADAVRRGRCVAGQLSSRCCRAPSCERLRARWTVIVLGVARMAAT